MSEDDRETVTQGLHHLGLSVPNLDESVAFFIDVLGFKTVGGNVDYPAVFVSDGNITLTLWQLLEPRNYIGFDRKKNAGLHHLALRLKDTATLNELYGTLQKQDIEIEFPPEPNSSGTAMHMMCYPFGGIRIEFIVPLQK